jgi:hypothetical protein
MREKNDVLGITTEHDFTNSTKVWRRIKEKNIFTV